MRMQERECYAISYLIIQVLPAILRASIFNQEGSNYQVIPNYKYMMGMRTEYKVEIRQILPFNLTYQV